MQKIGLLKILAAFLILTISPFFSARAIEHGGIGGKPAYNRSNNPRTDSIFIHNLLPGVTQEDGVLLFNNTSEQKTLLVYAVDAMTSRGSSFACRQLAEPKKNVSAWITLAKTETTLKGENKEIIPFTIVVPQNISSGEYNGCIVIQEKKSAEQKEAGVVLTSRTALRVAITIGGEISRKLEIIDFKAEQKKNGGYLLQPTVKNLGNVSIDANLFVATYFGGLLAYNQNGGNFPILRDETANWNFELQKPFWGGLYRADFVLEYDPHPEAGIGTQSGKGLTRLSGPSVWFFSFPQTIALVIEIIVAILFLIVILILFRFVQPNKFKR